MMYGQGNDALATIVCCRFLRWTIYFERTCKCSSRTNAQGDIFLSNKVQDHFCFDAER